MPQQAACGNFASFNGESQDLHRRECHDGRDFEDWVSDCGIGSGRLREAVREHLEQHPLVESYRSGTEYEGRDGATVVTLKG